MNMSTRVNTVTSIGSVASSSTIISSFEQSFTVAEFFGAASSLCRRFLTWLLNQLFLRIAVFVAIVLWPWQSAW